MEKLKCPKCGGKLYLEDITESGIDWKEGTVYQIHNYTCEQCEQEFVAEAYAELHNQQITNLQGA